MSWMRCANIGFQESRLLTKHKNLIGLVSTEDLIKCLANQDIDKCVQEYMTTELVTVNSFDHLTEALKLFAKTKLGRLPVLGVKGNWLEFSPKGMSPMASLEPLNMNTRKKKSENTVLPIFLKILNPHEPA